VGDLFSADGDLVEILVGDIQQIRALPNIFTFNDKLAIRMGKILQVLVFYIISLVMILLSDEDGPNRLGYGYYRFIRVNLKLIFNTSSMGIKTKLFGAIFANSC
jgi:hypothetical protein